MKTVLTLFLSSFIFSNLYSQVVSQDSIPIFISTSVFEEELEWIEDDEWINLRITEFNTNEVYYDTSATVYLSGGFSDTVYLDSGLYKCEVLDIGANVNMPTILLNNGDIVPWGYPDYEYYLFSVTPYVDPCLTMSTNDTIDIVACESYSWNNVEYTESGFYTDSLTSSLGCESVINLNLIVNYSSTCLTTVESCNGTYEWNGQSYTQSGEYIFETINSAGCDSIATLVLAIDNVVDKPNIVQYYSTTLKTDENQFYQWYRNGNLLEGETTQYLNFSVGGSYTVIVKNSLDCEEESEPFIVGEAPSEDDDFSLSAYPNPTSGMFTLEIPSIIEEYTIKLYNQIGELKLLINSENVYTSNPNINIGNFPNGFYLIKFCYDDNVLSQSIIKN